MRAAHIISESANPIPMDKKEFQTIHETGVTSLLEKLGRYGGAERSETSSGFTGSASAARLEQTESSLLLSSSGIYIEGTHFDLVYTPLQHLGYKLSVAAASKIYSMNGQPVMAQVGLAVPNKVSVQMVEQIYGGFDRAGLDCNHSVKTGDITASRQGLAISVHVTGTVSEENIVSRKGCQNGDQICVTGDLGGAMAGLRILLREKEAWKQSGKDRFNPDLQEYEYVLQRQLMPVARRDFIASLAKAEIKPTSMIELSQGLMNEIQLIIDPADSGCEIFTPAVPISLETRKVADEIREDVDRYAFYGGEDYEMLFTLKKEDVEKLKTEFEDFSVIGEVKPKERGIRLNTGEGKSVDISSSS